MKTFITITTHLIILTSLLSSEASAQNLVVNSSFDLGNYGFTSEYVYSPTNLFPARTYAILTNPHLAHDSFVSMGDHTTGTGNMMVVNGATGSSPIVWSQQINVNPDRMYYFSTWAANVLGGTPSRFVLRVNGITLEPQVTLPNQAALWQNYTTTWNSGGESTAQLEIIFTSTEYGGNDSALDDIVFREARSVSTPIVINHAVCIEWTSELGVDYQLQSSYDLAVWTDIGLPIPGTGALMSYCEKINDPMKFYQVIGLVQ